MASWQYAWLTDQPYTTIGFSHPQPGLAAEMAGILGAGVLMQQSTEWSISLDRSRVNLGYVSGMLGDRGWEMFSVDTRMQPNAMTPAQLQTNWYFKRQGPDRPAAAAMSTTQATNTTPTMGTPTMGTASTMDAAPAMAPAAAPATSAPAMAPAMAPATSAAPSLSSAPEMAPQTAPEAPQRAADPSMLSISTAPAAQSWDAAPAMSAAPAAPSMYTTPATLATPETPVAPAMPAAPLAPPGPDQAPMTGAETPPPGPQG